MIELTPTQEMIINIFVSTAIRAALEKIQESSKEELDRLIENEQARKDEILARIKGH